MSTAPDPLPFASDDPVIRLAGVSVRYRVPHDNARNLKQWTIRTMLGKGTSTSEFWALRDVDLAVGTGGSLGIVGHNGAGKSTLLKVISRVIRPTAGRVRVGGRVAPLLELGTGFDPELTGRENVLLNGMMLGFSRRDVAARLDRIVDFAGIGAFIDAPLRTYSSGMVARLAFSSATDVDPTVLLVDEVLSVGDVDFQKRSAERIADFGKRGGTVVVVSHNPEAIRSLCRTTLWMEQGRVRMHGPTDEVLARYLG